MIRKSIGSFWKKSVKEELTKTKWSKLQHLGKSNCVKVVILSCYRKSEWVLNVFKYWTLYMKSRSVKWKRKSNFQYSYCALEHNFVWLSPKEMKVTEFPDYQQIEFLSSFGHFSYTTGYKSGIYPVLSPCWPILLAI